MNYMYAPWASSLDGYVHNINVAIIIIIIMTPYYSFFSN